MGLTASIYRSSLGDCSAGGISGRVDRVTIVNVEGPFEPSEDAPAVLLVPGNVPLSAKVIEAVEVTGPGAAAEYHGKWGPRVSDGTEIGPMMGGTYVGTSDSRFCLAVEKLTGSRGGAAVPLHDRYEAYTQERFGA